MLSITDLKTGVVIDIDGAPFEVIKYQHAKMGRGGAILRTTLKNLITGANLEKTFKGDSKFNTADINKNKAQFLYREGNDYLFMDTVTFDQFPLSQEVLGRNINFLIEGQEINIKYFNKRPIDVELPLKMKFKVTQAEPAVKGDSVGNPTKNATIETGLQVKVPLFVKIGDTILVDTRTNGYIERTQS